MRLASTSITAGKIITTSVAIMKASFTLRAAMQVVAFTEVAGVASTEVEVADTAAAAATVAAIVEATHQQLR
jgi:hypothetical protein